MSYLKKHPNNISVAEHTQPLLRLYKPLSQDGQNLRTKPTLSTMLDLLRKEYQKDQPNMKRIHPLIDIVSHYRQHPSIGEDLKGCLWRCAFLGETDIVDRLVVFDEIKDFSGPLIGAITGQHTNIVKTIFSHCDDRSLLSMSYYICASALNNNHESLIFMLEHAQEDDVKRALMQCTHQRNQDATQQIIQQMWQTVIERRILVDSVGGVNKTTRTKKI